MQKFRLAEEKDRLSCSCKLSRPSCYGYKIGRQTKGKTDHTITTNAGMYVNTIVEFGLVHIMVRYHK